jgi:hypothetical protein
MGAALETEAVCRQGPGISSEIETQYGPEAIQMREYVARGLASRLRLKLNQLTNLMKPTTGRQGPGISSEGRN